MPGHDRSGVGGSVYATGLGPVTVTIHHVSEFISDRLYPYPMQVYWARGEEVVLLGSNYKHATLHLGNLPPGEIRLVGNCPIGDGVFRSGTTGINGKATAHSRVKQVRAGVVELYFENTLREGARNDNPKERHSFNDCKLTFSGAVVEDPGILVLLEKIHDKDPETRNAARMGLKLLAPDLANKALNLQSRGANRAN